MKMFAIEINRSAIEIITLLNNGVAPLIEKKKTYFLFDATWNSDIPNEIVTFRELSERFDIKSGSPLVLALKKI